MYAIRIKFMDSMLSWSRFHFTNSSRNRKVRHHNNCHIERVFEFEYSRRFDKHDVLIVSNSSPDFNNRNIRMISLSACFNPVNNFISYMWYSLDTFTFVPERPLSFYHRSIHHPRGHIISGISVFM